MVYIAQIFVSSVYIVGIIVAVKYKQKYPKASKLTIIALSVFLVDSLILTPLYVVIRRLGYLDNYINALKGYGREFIWAGGFILILYAAFGCRKKVSSEAQEIGETEQL